MHARLRRSGCRARPGGNSTGNSPPSGVQQPIGDEDVVAFQLRAKPSGESGRDDAAGPMAVDEDFGGPPGVVLAGAGENQSDAASAESAFADGEAVAANRDRALEQIFEAARLDPERKDEAEVARLWALRPAGTAQPKRVVPAPLEPRRRAPWLSPRFGARFAAESGTWVSKSVFPHCEANGGGSQCSQFRS